VTTLAQWDGRRLLALHHLKQAEDQLRAAVMRAKEAGMGPAELEAVEELYRQSMRTVRFLEDPGESDRKHLRA
jgi:hypothetical protein